MQGTLTVRLLVALGLLGLAGYFLVPTLVYFGLSEEETAEVRQSKDAFDKFNPSWAPDNHIVPGLDLQGGIHIVLGVDLDKAISDRARRTANRVRDRLTEKEIKFSAVDHLPEEGTGDRIRVRLETSDQREAFDKELADFFGDLVTVSTDDTEYILRIHPDYATRMRQDAVSRFDGLAKQLRFSA